MRPLHALPLALSLGLVVAPCAFAQIAPAGTPGVPIGAGGGSAAIGGGTMGPASGAIPGGGSTAIGGGTMGPSGGPAIPGGGGSAVALGTLGPAVTSAAAPFGSTAVQGTAPSPAELGAATLAPFAAFVTSSTSTMTGTPNTVFGVAPAPGGTITTAVSPFGLPNSNPGGGAMNAATLGVYNGISPAIGSTMTNNALPAPAVQNFVLNGQRYVIGNSGATTAGTGIIYGGTGYLPSAPTPNVPVSPNAPSGGFTLPVRGATTTAPAQSTGFTLPVAGAGASSTMSNPHAYP